MKKSAALLSVIMLAATGHAEEATTVIRGPVMMDLGSGMQLEVEYIEAKDYKFLQQGTDIAAQTQFFAETSATFENFSPPALRVHIEAMLLAQRMLRSSECKDPSAADCGVGGPVPNTWGILTRDSEGCRGDTLLTGFTAPKQRARKGSSSYEFEMDVPVTDFRLAGRLNGSDTLFFATLNSADPTTADGRQDIIRQFSMTCGLEGPDRPD